MALYHPWQSDRVNNSACHFRFCRRRWIRRQACHSVTWRETETAPDRPSAWCGHPWRCRLANCLWASRANVPAFAAADNGRSCWYQIERYVPSCRSRQNVCRSVAQAASSACLTSTQSDRPEQNPSWRYPAGADLSPRMSSSPAYSIDRIASPVRWNSLQHWAWTDRKRDWKCRLYRSHRCVRSDFRIPGSRVSLPGPVFFPSWAVPGARLVPSSTSQWIVLLCCTTI